MSKTSTSIEQIETYMSRVRTDIPNFSYTIAKIFDDGRHHVGVMCDQSSMFRFVKEGNKKRAEGKESGLERGLKRGLESSVEKEHRLLGMLQSYISVCRIPTSIYLSQDLTRHQETVITGLKMKELSVETAREMLPHIAKFLKQLHSVPISEAKKCGYYAETDNSGYVQYMKEQTQLYLMDCTDEVLRDRIYVFIETAFGYIHPTPCLIHGDMNRKNIYRDETLSDNQKLGVIDFDDAELFDPAKDFCAFVYKYDEEYFETLVEEYGLENEKFENFRERVIMHYERSRLRVCINHRKLNRKRTPEEVREELERLFG